MAYDEGLAARVRIRLEDRPGYGEKKMFEVTTRGCLAR